MDHADILDCQFGVDLNPLKYTNHNFLLKFLFESRKSFMLYFRSSKLILMRACPEEAIPIFPMQISSLFNGNVINNGSFSFLY